MDVALVGPRPACAERGRGGRAAVGRRDRPCSYWSGSTPGRARAAVGRDLDMVADLVGHGTLAASLPVFREGGRAGSIVELAGDLELASTATSPCTACWCDPPGRPLMTWRRRSAPAGGGQWSTRCSTYR
jgi:hypothetical protein